MKIENYSALRDEVWEYLLHLDDVLGGSFNADLHDGARVELASGKILSHFKNGQGSRAASSVFGMIVCGLVEDHCRFGRYGANSEGDGGVRGGVFWGTHAFRLGVLDHLEGQAAWRVQSMLRTLLRDGGPEASALALPALVRLAVWSRSPRGLEGLPGFEVRIGWHGTVSCSWREFPAMVAVHGVSRDEVLAVAGDLWRPPVVQARPKGHRHGGSLWGRARRAIKRGHLKALRAVRGRDVRGRGRHA